MLIKKSRAREKSIDVMAKVRYNVLALIAVSVVEITCGIVPKGTGWPEVL